MRDEESKRAGGHGGWTHRVVPHDGAWLWVVEVEVEVEICNRPLSGAERRSK